MNFKSLKIPNGNVTKIRDSDGNLLWRKNDLTVKVNAITCKNIIDNTTIENYLNRYGEMVSNTSWLISDFLPCESGNVEVASNGTAPSICFYDKNKDYISGFAYLGTNPKTVFSPLNAVYCKWSMSKSSVASSYVTLKFSNYTELFKTTMIDKVINIQGEVVTDYVTGSYNYTGEVNGIALPCDGKTTVNFDGFGVNASRLIVCFYDINDEPILSSRTKPNVVSGSLSVPADAYGVRFAYYYSVGGTPLVNAFKNFTVDIV